MFKEGGQFIHLHQPKLYLSEPVKREQARRSRAGYDVPDTPGDQLAAWFNLIDRTHSVREPVDRPYTNPSIAQKRLREYYYRRHIIDPQRIPQSYWNNLAQQFINEGQGADLRLAGVVERAYIMCQAPLFVDTVSK